MDVLSHTYLVLEPDAPICLEVPVPAPSTADDDVECISLRSNGCSGSFMSTREVRCKDRFVSKLRWAVTLLVLLVVLVSPINSAFRIEDGGCKRQWWHWLWKLMIFWPKKFREINFFHFWIISFEYVIGKFQDIPIIQILRETKFKRS